VSDPQDPQQWQPPPGDAGAPPPPPPPPGPSYGAPPPPPPSYGTPPPSYGTPPGGGYGQPAAYGAPTPGWSGPPLAEWPKRAGAFVIDQIGPFIAVAIVSTIFGAISDVLGALISILGYLAALAWALYNAYLAGQTGQSYGMTQFKLRLLREADGQPIGGGMGIARVFIHFLDSLACYVGWLWPLWDPKKQTFTDKITSTVVIDEGV
jgi:uncharacterized RDD family membrane protein YckC